MRLRFTWLVLGAALATAACRDEAVTHARVPKPESSAAPMTLPPELAAPSEKTRGLAWTLPSGWKELPGDGMRLATFVPPGGLKTEATVVALPGDSGGELANANRWRGQIGLPATDEAGMAAARTTLGTKAGPAAIYDFTGTGEVRARLIAAVVNTGGMTWFFKLKGDAAATETARPGFLSIIKGLKADAPR
ncbi:MAG: hypothetical protein HY923_10370 [Elusimicrobia bacterium]|nr:hypothetical protein [Elusimicrobiota bacterium]